ncbi:MAG: substrate-binding domain-containing protein [Actinomycetota bacterium]
MLQIEPATTSCIQQRSTRIKIRRIRLASALVALSLSAAACAGGEAGDADSGLSGTVVISGSSTVEPISIGVAEKFALVAPGVNVSVDGPGTGDGFELFCRGETDISDASRAISEEEVAACQAAGVEFIELKVANDGIAVLTSSANNDVKECLSFSDIYALVGPESQGFGQWSAANTLASSLGSTKGSPFPNVPLAVTGPGEESGTYDSFVELVLEDVAEGREKQAQTRPDYQASADDNVIIQGIEGSDTSFGWVGFAFFKENRQNVRAFQVAGEDGECVEPTAETIASGSYPISRPLFIYVNSGKLLESEALAEFVDLYLSDDGIASVSDAGYVQLDPAELTQTRERFDSRTTGKA